jgi:crotonobetainyl-CoA:carnitine CoA-transferase CaiB-like acyl-CoA transferase
MYIRVNLKRMAIDTFFKDLKVIELSSVLAGPSVGMFFAELGAKVLKVENKVTGGDATRMWRLPGESEQGPSAYFCSVNHGKEHLLLDLGKADDRQRLYSEMADADIVLSNYRPATAAKLGVTYAQLKEVKKDLIFIQLDGFEGHDRAAYDVVLQAETGWISMTGSDADHLAKLPVALIDILAGHQMKEAALMGLLRKMQSGEGSYWQCSLEKASLAALANQANNYLMCGHIAQPIGTQHPNIAPYGDMYRSADGRLLVLAVGSDAQFAKLCEALQLEGLPSAAKFASNSQRVLHREALNEALRPAFARHDLRSLQDKLDAMAIPYGVVRSLDEVLQSPAAQAMTLRSDMEGRATSRLSGIAFTAQWHQE